MTHQVDAGGLRQLLIRVMAIPEVGTPVILQALVDTGAETNLIRTFFFALRELSAGKGSVMFGEGRW